MPYSEEHNHIVLETRAPNSNEFIVSPQAGIQDEAVRDMFAFIEQHSGDEPSNAFEATEKEGEDAYWFDFDNKSIEHFEYDAEKHEWTFTEEGMRVLH